MKELWQLAAEAGVKEQDSKAGGLVLLIAGFFLAPIGIGIPMMIVGAIKLFK